MTIHLLLFAKARDLVGRSQIDLQLPSGSTVGDLRIALQQDYPALRPILARLHIAVNNDYAANGDIIPETAEVACFPPVSGG